MKPQNLVDRPADQASGGGQHEHRTPAATIAVGVVVERSKGVSQWTDFFWRPVSVLAGAPETAPWTKLSDDGERATFFAGSAEIELYRTETTYYRNNLESGRRCCGSRCARRDGDPPYTVAAVTADPAEGESLTETATDLIEQVPMPEAIQESSRPLSPSTMSSSRSSNASATAPIRKRWRGARRAKGSRMNEPENFLERWSRRKRDSDGRDRAARGEETLRRRRQRCREAEADEEAELAGRRRVRSCQPAADRIDRRDTDIRAFLQPGVPADLRVRRFVAPGPPIRRSATSSGWRRTTGTSTIPNGIPGFGPLHAGERSRRLLAQRIGGRGPASHAAAAKCRRAGQFRQIRPQIVGFGTSATVAARSVGANARCRRPKKDFVQRNKNMLRSQNNSDNQEDLPPSRRRGTAARCQNSDRLIALGY